MKRFLALLLLQTTGISLERVGIGLAVLTSMIGIAAGVSRHVRRPWEKPMADLQAEINKMKIEKEHVTEEVRDIKEMLKDHREDVEKKFDRIDGKVNDLLEYLLKTRKEN